jgi:hypothetical protein
LKVTGEEGILLSPKDPLVSADIFKCSLAAGKISLFCSHHDARCIELEVKHHSALYLQVFQILSFFDPGPLPLLYMHFYPIVISAAPNFMHFWSNFKVPEKSAFLGGGLLFLLQQNFLFFIKKFKSPKFDQF